MEVESHHPPTEAGNVLRSLWDQPVCLQCRRPRFNPWVGKISWRRKWQPTPAFLPGKCHGQRSLVGYSPRGCKELDTTEHTHIHTRKSFTDNVTGQLDD